jgi:transcriptional antiterminator RfaH
MRNWYVLMHNPLIYQSLISMIEALDVEVLPLSRVSLRKRKDRPSYVSRQVALFPGYLLLHFDPQVTHTTAITALNGAHGFIRFSDQPCILQDEVVQKLQEALVRTDRSLDSIDYRNLPTDLERSLHTIIDIRSETGRKAAFCALLQQGAALERLVSQSRVLCYTSVNAL